MSAPRWSERQLAMLLASGVSPAWLALAQRRSDTMTTPVTAAPIAASRPPDAARPTLRAGTAAPAAAAPVVATLALDARAQRIGQLDWQALRADALACQACGLSESRRQVVFGTGSTQARWLLVGEAPGEQEDARGEPFVGAAGQLLDRILAALGLTRSADQQQVFIANTLKCRPPRNRNPQPQELAACAPYLARQIELIAPQVIVAMGRFAIQQLLHSDEAIGRLRGRVHDCNGTPLIVSYHPAYLLRQPADKAKAWVDWCLAASVLAA